MRQVRRREAAGSSRHIPAKIVQKILVTLPTRDVVRSSCVSKEWYGVVKDPSFPRLHAAEHAPGGGGGAEALLVTLNLLPGSFAVLEPSIFSVSSSKQMFRITGSMAMSHDPTNVCNGFICFQPNVLCHGMSPPVLCNPATAETLALPHLPPFEEDEIDRCLFLLGSTAGGEYKLFRISFRELSDDRGNYLDVYTLGDSRGWRKQPHLVPFRQIYGVPPVYADGRLYLVTGPLQFAGNPEGILVIDVATEAHCTYRLPDDPSDDDETLLVDVLELQGRFCLAVNYVLVSPERPKVEFWVMPRLDSKNHRRLNWELRYTFYVDVDHRRRKAAVTPYVWGHEYKNQLRAAWLDENEMLCYMLGDSLYKYNTNSRPSSSSDRILSSWHHKVKLPTTPSPSSSNRQWNICGGYRPTLLSPRDFALPFSQEDDDNGQFEQDMLHALRYARSTTR